MKVKILSGAYGYTPPGARSVRPVYHGQTVTVDDREGRRLIALGAAAPADPVPETPPPALWKARSGGSGPER